MTHGGRVGISDENLNRYSFKTCGRGSGKGYFLMRTFPLRCDRQSPELLQDIKTKTTLSSDNPSLPSQQTTLIKRKLSHLRQQPTTISPLGAIRQNDSFTDHPVTMNPNFGFPSKYWLCRKPIIHLHGGGGGDDPTSSSKIPSILPELICLKALRGGIVLIVVDGVL